MQQSVSPQPVWDYFVQVEKSPQFCREPAQENTNTQGEERGG